MIELAVTLTDEQLEQIAAQVAELLPARAEAPESLLTVDALATQFDTSTDWVRRHQAELGAFRLSDGGGRNPIRFKASVVERFLAERQLTAPPRASWRENPDWALG